MKLTRKQIQQGLDQTPVIDILGAPVAKQLTKKQRDFAMNLARGDTGAAAYRKAYNTKAKPKTQAIEAHKLKSRPDIAQVTEAYSKALEAQAYQTPAALRALVIQSLVNVLIDDEANNGQVIAAAKVLGTVTEVAAFTERKEVTTITSSEDARARVMMQLRAMMNSQAEDATTIEAEATALENELRTPAPSPTTPNEVQESLAPIHTIPHEQSQSNSTPQGVSNSAQPSIADDLETPPVDVSNTKGV